MSKTKTCACGKPSSCDCGKCVGCCGAASSLSREGAPAEDRAREAPGPRTAEPIHWLGDATQDRDVYELRERYPGRLTTLGGPTTLYFTMPNGEPIIVPVGWWICDDAGEPYVASAPPSPGALDRAREETLHRMLDKATIRLGILRDRNENCQEERRASGLDPGHAVSDIEVPGWIEEQRALLLDVALRALAGDAAPAPADTEARLAAFVTKYRATGVCLLCCPEDREPWALHWQRTYPDDVTSDERGVWGASMAAVVAQAEEWEVKNDAREPQHAAAPVSPSGGATTKEAP